MAPDGFVTSLYVCVRKECQRLQRASLCLLDGQPVFQFSLYASERMATTLASVDPIAKRVGETPKYSPASEIRR
jgi:hypothetical protein